MSNYLAIATVTATLRYILLNSLPPDLSGAQVTTVRPDANLVSTETPGINIFLYQVAPNAAFRNCDLPERRPDGTLVQRPLTALDLKYLFTFYGNDADLEPQRLLGSVASTLQSFPILSAEEIGQALAHAQPFNAAPFTGAPFNAPPYQPDLALQFERVRLTMMPFSLDELSKLWSVFYQIPFALTLGYQASVVLIEREELAAQAALPVARTKVAAIPFQQPTIMSVAPQAGATQPILAGGTLLIQGVQLAGSVIMVQFSNEALPVKPATVTDTQITVGLPLDLPAGAQGVQVVQQTLLGVPPVPHTTFESNVWAFVLRPQISGAVTASATQVSFQVNPTARAGQRAVLLLNEATSPAPPAPAAYSFSLPPLAADTTTLTFPISGVQGKTTYFVRVQLDGAESPLDLNPSSTTFGPRVTFP